MWSHLIERELMAGEPWAVKSCCEPVNHACESNLCSMAMTDDNLIARLTGVDVQRHTLIFSLLTQPFPVSKSWFHLPHQ
jgi:hypothetical protein